MVFRLALFAILAIAALLALYFVTRNKWDWNKYAGSLAVVFCLLLLVPLAMFSWVTYDNRLTTVNKFSGIQLGANSAEVKFIKGMPDTQTDMGESKSHWRYIDKLNKGNQLNVYFSNGKVTELSFAGNCEYCDNIKSFGIGSAYEEVIERFGTTQDIEISENELEHRLNYPEYQVFFVFKEKKVIRHGIYQP